MCTQLPSRGQRSGLHGDHRTVSPEPPCSGSRSRPRKAANTAPMHGTVYPNILAPSANTHDNVRRQHRVDLVNLQLIGAGLVGLQVTGYLISAPVNLGDHRRTGGTDGSVHHCRRFRTRRNENFPATGLIRLLRACTHDADRGPARVVPSDRERHVDRRVVDELERDASGVDRSATEPQIKGDGDPRAHHESRDEHENCGASGNARIARGRITTCWGCQWTLSHQVEL